MWNPYSRMLRLLLAILFLPASYSASAQIEKQKPGLMEGKIIEQPERFSGVWEAAIGSGNVVGLHFLLTTKVAGAPTSLTIAAQSQDNLMIGVYQRSVDRDLQFGDENGFMDSPDSGVLWDGKHLVLKPLFRVDPVIHLDLMYDENRQAWTGFFHRRGFSGNVVLQRPSPDNPAVISRLVGTWVGSQPGMNGCVHIVQRQDGTLAGWSDDLVMPGLFRYAPGLKPPAEAFERYGDLVKVTQMMNKDIFSIEFKAYNAMCCSHTFTGKLSADNSILDGGGQPGANQISFKAIWRKVRGDSCR